MKSNTFWKDLDRGRLGEELVLDVFNRCGYEIFDYTKDEDQMKDDVDLIAADGLKYEVKTDGRVHDTHNLLIEDKKTYSDGTTRQGWLWGSKADCFVFINGANPRWMYMISVQSLQGLCRTGQIPHRTIADTDYTKTDIFLLPLGDYLEAFLIIDTTDDDAIGGD